MSKKNNLLNSLEVKNPCNESWDEMTGNAEVRFCSHCAANVHDLSAMTRAKAEKLVRASNGKLCVRYTKNEENKIVHIPTQIRRRPTIAAGVLAATLAVTSAAYSQGSPIPVEKPTVAQTQKNKRPDTTGNSVIHGTVVDAKDALVVGAKVVLVSPDQSKAETTTDTDGRFVFANLDNGIFSLEVTMPWFKKTVIQKIDLKDTYSQKIVMEVSEVTMGFVEILPKLETPIEKLSSNLTGKQIIELPAEKKKKTKKKNPK